MERAAFGLGGRRSDLVVATGTLTALRQSQGYADACLLGPFIDTTVATDSRPDPAPVEGAYDLVRRTCAAEIGFGHSCLVPDPRDALDAAPACSP